MERYTDGLRNVTPKKLQYAALRHSCHPPQLASQLSAHLTAQPASQQCTQMAQNGFERPFSAICVHYCVTTGRPRGPRAAARSATVYTNGPERRRRAVFANLCTLLRPPPVSSPAARATPASQQCTQMAQNRVKRSFSAICVHYWVTTGCPRGPRAATVYTNAPKRLREDVFGDLCTLLRPPASPRAARVTLAAQQCAQSRSP